MNEPAVGSTPTPAESPADAAGGVAREENVFEVLAARARKASDGRLAIDASVGVVALLSLPFVRPLHWGLVLPFVIVGAYGLWGICDRELAEGADRAELNDPMSSKRDVLTLLKRASVGLGILSAVVGGLMLLVLLLGRTTN